MSTHVSHLVVALVLVAMSAYMLPILVRRFRHVGRRYQIAVVSGYVFVTCSVILLLADRSTWLDTMIAVSVVQALASVVLACATIGRMDIVFSGKRQRIKGASELEGSR